MLEAALHEAEVDVEAVGEAQHVAFLHVGGDLLVVDVGGDFVGHEHHDDVAGFGGGFHFHDLQTSGFSLGPAGAALAQTDDNVHAAFMQVLSMSVTLAAVADDGDSLAVEHAEIAVCVIVLLNHDNFSISMTIIHSQQQKVNPCCFSTNHSAILWACR